jgi:hypothetical protein
LTELKRAKVPRAVETMRASAHLLGLDITVIHRQSPDGASEEIAINMRALPSFAAFGRSMGTLHPLAFWMEAARLAWAPWLAATHMLLGGDNAGLLAKSEPPHPGAR